MKVTVTLEHRFDSTPDGKVWTQTMFAYPFWLRYLEVFEQVLVVARVRQVPAVLPDWKRADGERVSFVSLPHYLGPWQYLLKFREIQKAAINAVSKKDAVILRVPSQIATSIQNYLSRDNYPYGLEVVGDPYDVFAPGAVKNPLRPFFRWWFTLQLKRQCANACAVSYVTEKALQSRYSPSPEAFSSHYSSIELPDSAIVTAPREAYQEKSTFTLITVGTLAQLYKAPDVLIDAVAACVRDGLDLKLVLVGDGKHRAELEARVTALNLKERVHFCGQLPAGDAVLAQLDQADLFVLPSYQEGLPRAMIEAMARALPCIGSNVGGIPELLPDEYRVPPGDVIALAAKIREVITNPGRMNQMSVCNLKKAKDYSVDILQERRTEFYRYLRERTEAWLGGKS